MPITKDTSKFYDGITGPVVGGFAVTPNNTLVYTNDGTTPPVTRSLWVGGSGDVAVVTIDDSAITFKGVGAGTLLPIRVKQVKATGTTATDIVGVY